jgi:hypothetical protein
MFSRRELVIRRPSENFSITGASARYSVRMDEVGDQSAPAGPRSCSSPAASRARTAGRWTTSCACHGWAGTRTVPSGRAGPSPANGARRSSALSSSDESELTTDGSAANQCSGNAPRVSGE